VCGRGGRAKRRTPTCETEVKSTLSLPSFTCSPTRALYNVWTRRQVIHSHLRPASSAASSQRLSIPLRRRARLLPINIPLSPHSHTLTLSVCSQVESSSPSRRPRRRKPPRRIPTSEPFFARPPLDLVLTVPLSLQCGCQSLLSPSIPFFHLTPLPPRCSSSRRSRRPTLSSSRTLRLAPQRVGLLLVEEAVRFFFSCACFGRRLGLISWWDRSQEEWQEVRSGRGERAVGLPCNGYDDLQSLIQKSGS
jgi:hypothetical protein